jgi:hypothetical protein
VQVRRGSAASVPLSEWLNEHRLLLLLDRDGPIQGDLLFEANHNRDPYDRIS